MIGIYFSGTGNTKHCLKVFMSEIDQEVPCISIEDENAGFGDEKALKNIDIADGQAQANGKCTMCYRCVSN